MTASGLHHPPRPALALNLGITGHRAIEPGDRAAHAATLAGLFARIAASIDCVASANARFFAPAPPVVTLVSPLAEGADQIAAEVALELGFTLHALLPFSRDIYARDFSGAARDRYLALLARADSVWTLPEQPAPGPGRPGVNGYLLAGRATVAQCDILVAIWDGGNARGQGGTTDIIDDAVRRGVPVIHLPTLHGHEPEILWAGFDEFVSDLIGRDDAPRRPLAGPALETTIAALVAPTEPVQELELFLHERERRLRSRFEWMLLLAVVGVLPMNKGSFRAPRYADAAQLDWDIYRTGALGAAESRQGVSSLESAFAWADGLAQHYANVFRSGVVLNFAGSALAIVLSLVAIKLPAWKLPLLCAELLLISAVIANTTYGTTRQWHRRWLSYRYLAEQLRPLRSLKLLGAGSVALRVRGGDQRWTDWYAKSLWRGLGSPPDLSGSKSLTELAHHIASHELDGQVSYHRATAHRMHALDHRLHRLGLALFGSTILIGLVTLAALLFSIKEIKEFTPVLGLLSAMLPTVGAAIFGIRGAGDFAGTAGRSAETARQLAHAASLLRRDNIDQAGATRAVEEAASIMLADLAEWRSTYTHRKLAIPS